MLAGEVHAPPLRCVSKPLMPPKVMWQVGQWAWDGVGFAQVGVHVAIRLALQSVLV